MDHEKEENQAGKLQQLFEEVNNQPKKDPMNEELKKEDYIEVDVLNLPPRKEVHTNPKSRLQFTFNRPFIRITVVLILLIAILATMYFLMGEQLLQIF